MYDLWEMTMGASGHHDILLSILIREGGNTPVWGRKVTHVVVDGGEARRETIFTHYRNG